MNDDNNSNIDNNNRNHHTLSLSALFFMFVLSVTIFIDIVIITCIIVIIVIIVIIIVVVSFFMCSLKILRLEEQPLFIKYFLKPYGAFEKVFNKSNTSLNKPSTSRTSLNTAERRLKQY